MILLILGAVGSLASIVGLYAFVENRRSRRVKELIFGSTPPVPLATAAPVERDYTISLRYKPPGSETEEVIEGAYVAYLRFANFGREPIRRADLAPANPQRVRVDGSRVLDISLSAERRAVTQVVVEPPNLEPDHAEAKVVFNFLDYRDGAVIRVLTTDSRARLSLLGDVIGMPGGIDQIVEEPPGMTSLGRVGTALWLIATVAAFAGAAWMVQEAPPRSPSCCT